MYYMLDTNTVSYLLKNQFPFIKQHLQQTALSTICISSITEAELLRGLKKKPQAVNLKKLVNAFLIRTHVLPWDSQAAMAYASFRTACESEGKSLSAMDMLIASHSIAVGATLISNDKAFYQVERFLTLEDWTV